MKETEIKIQRALQAQAEKISPYENTEKAKKNILESIKKEETYMKKTNFKKTVILAAAICVLGSLTALGSGLFGNIVSHSSHLDEIKDFSKVAELTEKADLNMKYIKNFSNGYSFSYAVPQYSSYDDNETGKTSEEWTDISMNYKKDNAEDVYFDATTHVMGDMSSDDTTECDGITLNYTNQQYLFVPVDYEPTDEEKALQNEGNLEISYGSDEKEYKSYEYLSWEDGGIFYSLSAFDAQMGKDELADMAKEIIEE